MVELPLRFSESTVQVSSCGAPVVAGGGVVLLVTRAVAVDEQPEPGSVTVNVYVPAVLTVVAAVAAENPPGPLQL